MNKYLLITERTECFNPEDIAGHYEYLDRLKKEGRLEMYGPFGDTTGGAYLILASSLAEAEEIGNADPLIRRGSSTVTVKEWRLR
ncbi:Uncharacterized conserved protein YciI, contains a putative active-site phosphohistidine [Paenibacillus sophorae]|uniref:Uncharacterized conserved protein YciI, contains a putative active-site phosphohistidine n=1 Tax=Paenibacillus sophorae TaxID=1333845 RepID=A0A1H8ITK8_9BACL|nr:YciI family protein [Paenibacillus sophorae]QWU16065.1 hypothetical protein KP014_01950 [Paenibacillus sophorae]SEN71495.1 Uncharacterized conserved protein YciI, contains a putative active-site phosphohistidine [Paenibacillus sophorae]